MDENTEYRLQSCLKTKEQKILNDASNLTKPLCVKNILTSKTMECKKQYVCKYAGCNASYLKPSQLSRHTRLHTGEKPYKCNHPGCSKAYTNSSHLKRHAETHNLIKKRLQCNKCFLTISNYHNLKRHYTRVHSDNVLTCNECNMAFKKKHQLIQHIATHCGDTSFKCGKCNKIYTNIRRLKRHEATHEKEQKRYPCQVPECSEVFDKWTLLCKHEKTEHVIDYKCDQCEKKFSTKARLKYHSKIHEKDRPFIPCPYDQCNRKYMSESNLKSHIKVYHLGQKFICDICKMGLSSQRKLKEHIMRIHEGKAKEKTSRRSERRKRKDAGIPRKSMVSMLTGLKFVHHVDKELINRKKYDL